MKKIFTPQNILLVAILLCNNTFLKAQWTGVIAQNNAVCTAATIQANSQITSDGNGGCITVWEDARNGKTMIYAQRVDKNGYEKWSNNGIRISTSDSIQSSHKIIDDGKGGVYVAWTEVGVATYTDIYAQHIDSNGLALWAARGITICDAVYTQNEISMCKDTSSGFYISWTDNRTAITTSSDIYIQKVTASGTIGFALNGLAVNTKPKPQQSSYIVSDGLGNAFVSYLDYMGNAIAGYDVFVSKILSTGSAGGWATNVSSQQGNEENQRLISDSLGGAYIVWGLGTSTASGYNIYAQRVNASGAIQWAAGGIAICNATGVQAKPQIVADGFGCAIISWEDGRNTLYPMIYTQRVNKFGVAKWTANGKVVGSTAVNSQSNCTLVANGAGGAVYVFEDARTASTNGGYLDIYAQQFDSLGVASWGTTGVAISTASNQQNFPKIISANNGEYIFCWDDLRNGASDIYCSKAAVTGTLPLTLINFSAFINDKAAILNWQTSNEINVSHFEIEKSYNGHEFNYIGKIAANGGNKYLFTDLQTTNYTLHNTVYYRLKIIDKDGKFSFSKTVALSTKNIEDKVNVYPTVITTKTNIEINATSNAIYSIKLCNLNGAIVTSKQVNIVKGNNVVDFSCNNLTNGIYIMSIFNDDKFVKTIKLIKE